MRQIPELLAPVGGEEQLRAAVENGADAVYMGAAAYNARAGAGGFGGELLAQSVRYAHSKGVKVYITLNTLVTDEELEDAVSVAEECDMAGADALIVQDFGLARELRRRISAMELHLSTQGTVYDLEGVLAAEEMGFARVVLARETPFSQISEIASKTRVPLEVFVHGALCMCYSGQCQMSRFQGGRSGNRGECAQPCRLPYELLKDGKPLGEGRGGAGDSRYRLSPKDMCTVEHLGQLAAAGVESLKIEGRLKSPEYVAIVTGIYRKYLDLYRRDGQYEVSPQDRRALLQIFNRGGFTEGYLWENPRKDILSGRLPKHQGIPLGKIVSVRTAQTGRTIRQLLTVRLTEELHLGDGVEIHSRGADGGLRLSGNIVTYIGEAADGGRKRTENRRSFDGRRISGSEGKSRRKAAAGELVEIGDIPGQAHPGDFLYRISEKEQLRQARRTYEITSGQAKKESRKLPVHMELAVREGQPVRLSVAMAQGELKTTAVSQEIPQRAMKLSLSEEAARRQLEKTGDTMFALKGLTLVMDEGLTVRAAVLNQLRREALQQLSVLWEEQQKRGVRTAGAGGGGFAAEKISAGGNAITCGQTVADSETSASGGNFADEGRLAGRCQVRGLRTLYLFRWDEEMLNLAQTSRYQRFYVSYQAFLDEGKRRALTRLAQAGKQVFAWLPPVTQGREGQRLRQQKDQLLCGLQQVPGAALSVNNLGQLYLFRGCGVPLYGDYGLNLYNSADFAWAKEQGMSGAVVCHEAFENGFAQPMKELPRRFGMSGEVAVGGRIPLMISAHCPIGDAVGCRGAVATGACDGGRYALRDRKNRVYPLLTEKLDCRTYLFSENFRADEDAVERLLSRGWNVRWYATDKNMF